MVWNSKAQPGLLLFPPWRQDASPPHTHAHAHTQCTFTIECLNDMFVTVCWVFFIKRWQGERIQSHFFFPFLEAGLPSAIKPARILLGQCQVQFFVTVTVSFRTWRVGRQSSDLTTQTDNMKEYVSFNTRMKQTWCQKSFFFFLKMLFVFFRLLDMRLRRHWCRVRDFIFSHSFPSQRTKTHLNWFQLGSGVKNSQQLVLQEE